MENRSHKKPQSNFKQAMTGKNKLDIITFVNDTILEGTGNTIAPQLELALLVNWENDASWTSSHSLKWNKKNYV